MVIDDPKPPPVPSWLMNGMLTKEDSIYWHAVGLYPDMATARALRCLKQHGVWVDMGHATRQDVADYDEEWLSRMNIVIE